MPNNNSNTTDTAGAAGAGPVLAVGPPVSALAPALHQTDNHTRFLPSKPDTTTRFDHDTEHAADDATVTVTLSQPPQSIPADLIDSTFGSDYIDLASSSLNSTVVACSDEWFAPAANLLTPSRPVRKPGVFTHAGAWYDGWETRRHNVAQSDWVVVRLGVASGSIAGVEIDTTFFDGNHAPEVSVQAAFRPDNRCVDPSAGVDSGVESDASSSKDTATATDTCWDTILGRTECGPNRRQAWLLPTPTKPYTHVRLHMHPDGGIARFRVYGTVTLTNPAISSSSSSSSIDLAAAVNGGIVAASSDDHFGRKHNLSMPGRGNNMGDGWETRRTRGVHSDWAIVKLARPTRSIERVVVDTAFFRGNFPQSAQVFAIWEHPTTAMSMARPEADDPRWTAVVESHPMGPDREHVFDQDKLVKPSCDHVATRWVKLVIVPDGGVMRFRVFGKPLFL